MWRPFVLSVLFMITPSAIGSETVYKNHCASCHSTENTKAPPLSTLKAMAPERIHFALTEGKMKPQAANLGMDDMNSLIEWIAGAPSKDSDWAKRASCKDKSISLGGEGNVVGVGYGHRNLRHQSVTTINKDNANGLAIETIIAFPGASEMRAQPALVGDTLFLAVSELHSLFALDAETACIKWTYKSDTPLRSGVGFGQVTDDNGATKDIIFTGGATGVVHVVDPMTGNKIWSRRVGIFAETMITAQPVLHGGILYIAQSQWEIAAAGDPRWACCRTHGAVMAVDALTGEEIWTTHTMEHATKRGHTSVGATKWGPSGAPIWSAPAIDVKRGLLYVGTGENTSWPSTDTSDAIIAMDLKTGDIKWIFQATEDDVFNNACNSWIGGKDGPNCPENFGGDFDFGAGVVIAKDSDGREILVAGQKSGVVHGLDPDNNGAILWQTDLSDGTPLGGVHWGMSVMDGKVFVAIADPDWPMKNYTAKPGLSAIDLKSGEVLWHHRVERGCEFSWIEERKARQMGKRVECVGVYGLSAGVTTLPGLVISGALDGRVRIHDAETGDILWEDMTAVPHTSVYGPKGHGGAIDNNTIVVRGDRLYVQSGYALHSNNPGNLLIVYKLPGTK